MASMTMPGLGFGTRYPYGLESNPVNAAGSADVIPVKSCVVFVTKAGVDAMTLAAPVAGVYPSSNALGDILGAPADDGKEIYVYSTTAQAHTITTPANKINGSKHIATFAGVIGDYAHFIAFNGSWWLLDQVGITLS